MKLDGSGAIAWAKEFTLPAYYYGYESNAVRTVAFLDDGAVAFTGTVQQSTIDLGGGALGASQTSNRYFGVFESGGTLRWGMANQPTNSELALRVIDDDLVAVGPGPETFCDAACQAEIVQESEPNDTIAQADALGAGKFIARGAYLSPSESDYFAITVPEGASLVLSTSDSGSPSTCTGYSGLTFYGPTGTRLATDSGGNFIGGGCSLLSAATGDPQLSNLAAGTYFVRVFAWSSPYSYGYQLNVKINGVGASAQGSAQYGHAVRCEDGERPEVAREDVLGAQDARRDLVDADAEQQHRARDDQPQRVDDPQRTRRIEPRRGVGHRGRSRWNASSRSNCVKVRSARACMEISSKPMTLGLMVSWRRSASEPSKRRRPTCAPAIEPTVAPLQSVSCPHITDVVIASVGDERP